MPELEKEEAINQLYSNPAGLTFISGYNDGPGPEGKIVAHQDFSGKYSGTFKERDRIKDLLEFLNKRSEYADELISKANNKQTVYKTLDNQRTAKPVASKTRGR
jgi:hypothetical protein